MTTKRKDARTNYKDLLVGLQYGSRKIVACYPAESDLAGPGIARPTGLDDIIIYQDFAAGERGACTAGELLRWYHNNTPTEQ